MTDRQLLQQVLDALTYTKWYRVGLGEPKDPKLEAAITALDERLAHCDRCGKRLGGEGDIHTCSPPGLNLDPTPISGWGQQSIGMGIPVQPEQEPVQPVAGSDKVICPACCHPFRAIPENVQRLMLDAGFEPPFTTPPAKPAAQPAQQELVGREAYMAIREARENASEDAYFAARPEHDKELNRLMFRSGFYHGYPNTPPAAPAPVQPEQEPVALREALAASLTSVYVCGRVWDAWRVGTMTEDDFSPASECDELLDELVQAVTSATPPAAPMTEFDEAVAAVDNTLHHAIDHWQDKASEQAALLRECRFAIDELIKKKPILTSLLCGSNTLGNLRASLYDYRPQAAHGIKENT